MGGTMYTTNTKQQIPGIGGYNWETDFYPVVVLILSKKLTAESSASVPVVYKNPPPTSAELLYTTGAEEGVKVSVAIFPSSGGGV